MASNFGICLDKTSEGVGLNLAGDFDGTSAYELIYAIKKLPEDTGRINICANGLKNTYPFDLDGVHRFMRSFNGQSAKIVLTGNNVFKLD